jgi:RND superfamily putative drug exporter
VHAVPARTLRSAATPRSTSTCSGRPGTTRNLIIPIVLVVVLVILALLLRAIVAPLVLVATVVLSFGAALGVSALAFRHIFGFGGADTSLPLFVFVFLVALGIDYNIFLMTGYARKPRGTAPGEPHSSASPRPAA